jgi:hypothetical protein|tara:strand:- start:432 stop:572 length:141 start_codon:yes stop_codon:yes gene_type:complete
MAIGNGIGIGIPMVNLSLGSAEVSTDSFLLADSGFLLQEDGNKIII